MGFRGGPAVIDAVAPLQNRILEPLTQDDFMPTEDFQESILRKIKILIELRSTFFDPIIPQPSLDVRGLKELDHREKQTEQLTAQIQDIKALSTPLLTLVWFMMPLPPNKISI
jgi:hypothetical protein